MIFSQYVTIIIELSMIVGAVFFSNWRNWKEYYSTIMFTIGLSVTVTLLTYNNSLWYYRGISFLTNHVSVDLFLVYLFYPLLILIYLSNYPFKKRLIHQIRYILVWSLVWSTVEWFYVLREMTTHHNGWHMGWSAFIWLCMFIGIRLHYTRPLLTWFLCLLLTIFMITYFNLPIHELK